MSMKGLTVHRGARPIERAALSALPEPRSMGPRHRPVPHAEFVGTLVSTLAAKGVEIRKEEYAVSQDAGRLFGVLDVEWGITPSVPGRSFTLGLRRSTDESLANLLLAGDRTWICDNMAWSADFIALQRKSTTGLHLARSIDFGVTRWFAHAEVLGDQVRRLSEREITDEEAKTLLVDSVSRKVIPIRLFPKVIDTYFHPTPEWTDVGPRTALSLHGAFTRVLRDAPPEPRFQATARLGRFFGMALHPERNAHGLLLQQQRAAFANN